MAEIGSSLARFSEEHIGLKVAYFMHWDGGLEMNGRGILKKLMFWRPVHSGGALSNS